MAAESRRRAAHLGPERRRPMVLEAAAAVFARDGYQGASMTKVAARAEVSKAVVYACFPGGKDELHAAVLDQASDRCVRAVMPALDGQAAGSPGDVLLAVLRRALSWAEDDPDGFRLLFAGAPGGGGQAVARVTAARNRVIGELSRRAIFVLAGFADR